MEERFDNNRKWRPGSKQVKTITQQNNEFGAKMIIYPKMVKACANVGFFFIASLIETT